MGKRKDKKKAKRTEFDGDYIAPALFGQGTVFDFINREIRPMSDPPSVHTSDASIEASEAIKKRAPRLRQEVYETIVQYGPVTDEQIAYYAQMNPSTARPRRLELQRAGRIVQAGHGKTSTGRKAALWAVA